MAKPVSYTHLDVYKRQEEGEIVLPEHKRISITWLNKPFMIFTWIYLIGAFVSNYIFPIVMK